MPMNEEWVLADTNIISYIMRGDSLARDYVELIGNRKISISFITVGELYFGAEKAGWGHRKRSQIDTVINSLTIIMYENEIAKIFGSVVAQRERIGNPVSFHDAWIAACAIHHKIPFVTHNSKDFENISNLTLITLEKKKPK